MFKKPPHNSVCAAAESCMTPALKPTPSENQMKPESPSPPVHPSVELLGCTPSAHCWACRVSGWGHPLPDPSFDFLITPSQRKGPCLDLCPEARRVCPQWVLLSPHLYAQLGTGCPLSPHPHAITTTPCAASPQLPPHGGTSQGGKSSC